MGGPVLLDGEMMLHEGPANVGVGRGWLTLTNRRLLLQDWRRTRMLRSVEMSNVIAYGRTVQISWLQALVPIVPLIALALRNALAIRTQDGRTTVFVVRNPDLWADRIASGAAVTEPSAAGGISLPVVRAIFTAVVGFAGWAAVAAASGQFTGPAGPASIPACASNDARAALADAFSNNPSKNVVTLRLLDLRNATEVTADSGARRCTGIAVLNSGEEPISYTLSLSTTGDLLVQIGDPPAASAKPEDQPGEAATETWETPRAYFGGLGIAKWTDNLAELDTVQASVDASAQADIGLAEWSFVVVAAAGVEDDTIYVLAETLRAGQEPDECHACAPSLSVLELTNAGGGWTVTDRWLNFAEIGAFGHAEALAVELPGNGLGFAIPVTTGMGGVNESSCTIYQITPGGPRIRSDLSRAPSNDQPYTCE